MALDAATLDAFRTSHRQREATRAAQGVAQRERARQTAQRAADLLRTRFGSTRVRLFGSLVENEGSYFGIRSDIDLAAWGVPGGDYYLAVAQLQGLSSEFGIDLVAMERCPSHLRPAIEERGVDL